MQDGNTLMTLASQGAGAGRADSFLTERVSANH
jgi:hypothetical protein